MSLVIRGATPSDAAAVHRFICALARYEREPHAVEVTEEQLRRQLAAVPAPFECLLAEVDGQPAGFALFFHTYSTWKGKRGIFLEDLFVDEDQRGAGIGKALLLAVVRLAHERDCARVEWNVLRWNEPALGFYRALGAEPLDEWVMYRLTGPALDALRR